MKTITFTLISLLFCIPAAAQTYSGNSQNRNQDQSENSTTTKGEKSSMSMTGCVSENNGKYMLMTKDHPTGIELTASQDLKPHVGHTVSVTGTMQNSSSTGTAADSGNATSDKSRDANQMMSMHVNSVKMVSSTCNASNSGTSSGSSRNSGNSSASDKTK